MKALICPLVGLLLVFAPALRAQNIVPNGDFEEWIPVSDADLQKRAGQAYQFPELDGRMSLDRLSVICETPGTPSGVTITREVLARTSGDASVKIENVDAGRTGSIGTKEIELKPSTTYKFSVSYKMMDVAGDGIFVWTALGPSEDYWSKRKPAAHRPSPATGTADWTHYEFTFDTGPGDTVGTFSLQLRKASGTAWFDDWQIVEVGPAPVSTATPAP